MDKQKIITLTTDFGNRDYYAASMKGVILSINPDVLIVDNTHELNPFDITQGAFNLLNLYRYFPKGTIHVAVVDPGVGSNRKCLLICADGYLFVGPDNGIFSLVTENSESYEIYSISNNKFFLPDICTTFHGRDIFAPVASHLSLDVHPAMFGRKISNYKKINLPKTIYKNNTIIGQIFYEDIFGNLITNINSIHTSKISKIQINDIRINSISTKYNDVKKGSPLALIGSSGYLEISVNRGRAADIINKKSHVVCYLKSR